MYYLLLYARSNRLLKSLDTHYKEDQYNYMFIQLIYLGNTCYCHFNKCLNVPTYMVEILTHLAVLLPPYYQQKCWVFLLSSYDVSYLH